MAPAPDQEETLQPSRLAAAPLFSASLTTAEPTRRVDSGLQEMLPQREAPKPWQQMPDGASLISHRHGIIDKIPQCLRDGRQ
ncbi:hypothetical protein PpBr36_02469 [Pyricularia pennisetigena]|uniref:hypothetical protein n=1 Tax=Pyricularia pennisetigena TaxID=1578925 RepID=UPI001152B717|nr:hypothetical protein PpBr36_02469 [Pyricularia pennisetigena]TLS30447.1 hypothetical protein PpBr36_02469 [Pyricularia pennisetigena]